MRIAIVAAGFKPGEADKLRRAMATFKRVGTIDSVPREIHRRHDRPRLRARSSPSDCFKQIEGFGEYGFPESHAASFANLVYASAWIKCHYPDVFAAALLNSQPMGFYAPAQIVRDAQEHGVEVRPVDINLSDWDCTLEARPDVPPSALHPRHAEHARTISAHRMRVRLGFRQISGFSEDDAKTIESVRGEGFDSVRDLWLRTRLQARRAGKARATPTPSARSASTAAMRCGRCSALRRAGDKDDLPLFARVAMPELEPDVASAADAAGPAGGRGLSPSASVAEGASGVVPARRSRRTRHRRGTNCLPEMRPGRIVTVAGLVLVRQRPGTGNVIFMTLEDETGIANTIVWPKVFERFRPIIMGARLISVTGKLQNEKGVIHIVARQLRGSDARCCAACRTTIISSIRRRRMTKPSARCRAHGGIRARR